MRKKKRKVAAVFLLVMMMVLTACGNGSSDVQETVAPVVDEVEETEDEAVVEEEGEEIEEEELEEPEIEEPEAEEVLIPYAEKNELEFCEELSVETQAVVTNINDDTDMMVMPATWTLDDISIEDGEEEDTQIITIESTCTSYYWTDRKNRQMYSIVLPITRYCDLNSGQCFPNLNETGDMGLGYVVDDIKWNGITYEIDYTGNAEWEDDDSGVWTFDKESNGYIHPATVHYEDKFVVEPQGYNSLGMLIEPLIIADMEGREDGVQEDDALIKDVLDEREGCYLFSVMDIFEMLNEDSEEDSAVSDDKSGATTNNETSKDNTSSNSSGSKDNTTPKQEQLAHTHSYTSNVTKNPTCTEAGVKTYTCSCGDSYTESIPASGHQWSTTTETISHPSTGHYETVWKKEAFCGCGASGFQSQAELNNHRAETQCGATTGGIREWTENVWIVDSEGWDETITVTKCSVCGTQG